MPTAKQASPSGGTASPSAAPQMCAGSGAGDSVGVGFFGFAERKWFPPHPTLPRSLMRLQGGMCRGIDTGWATLPQAYVTPSPLPMGLSCREMHPPPSLANNRATGMSRSDGGFTLWTKPSGNQTTLSSPTAKSHQPSAGMPPAQTGGLDGEGTSPTCLEGLSPAGDCSSRSEDENSNC